jgi:DNA mismatch repair protein MutS2
MECRGQHYVVAVGGMKLSLRKEQLRPVAQLGQPTQATVPVRLPAEDALSEIDVRGLRSEELAPVVERALDAAIRADLPQLRIIHGKGTGALRTRLAEILRGDPRVSSFRIAPWNEGGAGVTVVTL